MKSATILVIRLFCALGLVGASCKAEMLTWPTQPDDIVAVHNGDLWGYIAAEHYAPHQLTHGANVDILAAGPDGIECVVGSKINSQIVIYRDGQVPKMISPVFIGCDYYVWLSGKAVLGVREASWLNGEHDDIWLLQTTQKLNWSRITDRKANSNDDRFYSFGPVSPAGKMIACNMDEDLADLRLIDAKSWKRLRPFNVSGVAHTTGCAWIDNRLLLISLFPEGDDSDNRFNDGIWKLDTRTGKCSRWRYSRSTIDNELVGSANGNWVTVDVPDTRDEQDGDDPYSRVDVVNTHTGLARRTRRRWGPEYIIALADDGRNILICNPHEDPRGPWDGLVVDVRTGRESCFARDIGQAQFVR